MISPLRPLRTCGLYGFLSIVLVSCLANEEGEEEVEPVVTVLFPWFMEIMGVIVFFIGARYINIFPYTAVMFLLGTLVGIGVSRRQGTNELAESVAKWLEIDSEVLLLVFLPGLVFKDAFGLNVHLFALSFWQLLIFAFPMVLAGTTLTALVAFYIFPYDWSFNLSMTIGAILSATDPVAVSSLLAELGAPPRLKMHISGESLMNDGSALVFFNIFSGLYLAELGVNGVGESLSVGEGFSLFFRASLGGTAIGIGFGIGLVLVLYLLSKRLLMEENVVQVAATITFAYLTYYVADVVAETSGVIAVVFCGVTAKAFGSSMINDQELMDSFWALVEHLLNTVLFALGGIVWGEIISNSNRREEQFSAQDWGYLFLLYVFLHLIRFFIMYAAYPLTRSIGLSTNWRETFFSSFAGLRGAVGIALAISLDNKVFESTEDSKFRTETSTLFGMVGGIAFLTLFINGTLSGSVLRKLDLASSSEVREKIVESYRVRLVNKMLDDFVYLLTDLRFRRVDYSVIDSHIDLLKEVTVDDFQAAVERNREEVAPKLYKEPYVDNVLAAFRQKGVDETVEETVEDPTLSASAHLDNWSFVEERFKRSSEGSEAIVKNSGKQDTNTGVELRLIFIELLRYQYAQQVKNGELDDRRGFIAFVLTESLDFTTDAVNKGGPICDWESAEIVSGSWFERGDLAIRKHSRILSREGLDSAFQQLRVDVHRALAFVDAHWKAQERFRKEFVGGEFSTEEQLIIEESNAQVCLAVQVLKENDAKDVENVVAHLLCKILLNKHARFLEQMSTTGLLSAKEATEQIEHIEKELDIIHSCAMDKH